MTTLPGAPSIQNVIPTKVLGTSLTAAPIISLAASLTLLVFGLLYMAYCLKKSLANGETYTEEEDEAAVVVADKTPNLFLSVLPYSVLLGRFS